MLDDTGALQQATLISLTLEIVAKTSLNDTFQVTCQLAHLSRSKEHIGCAIVIKEQRCVMEMAQTRVDGPRTFSLGSREDVSVAHRTALVGSEQRPELSIVVL